MAMLLCLHSVCPPPLSLSRESACLSSWENTSGERKRPPNSPQICTWISGLYNIQDTEARSQTWEQLASHADRCLSQVLKHWPLDTVPVASTLCPPQVQLQAFPFLF